MTPKPKPRKKRKLLECWVVFYCGVIVDVALSKDKAHDYSGFKCFRIAKFREVVKK